MPDPDPKTNEDPKTGDPTNEDPKKTEDKTWTIPIDGESKTFTEAELLEAAGKGAGADAKFERISKMEKKAAKGLEILDLSQKIQESTSPSVELQTEFLQALGTSPDTISKMLGASKPEAKPDKKTTQEPVKAEPLTMDKLGKREREILENAEKRQFTEIRNDIQKSCEKSVDNDKVLGKMIDELPSDRKDAWINSAKRLLSKDVERRILGREEYGPDLIASSLQTVRALLKDLGVPAQMAGQPPMEGLDYSTVLGPGIHATEPIKRVAVDDADYESNAAQRLQQLVYAGMRKGEK